MSEEQDAADIIRMEDARIAALIGNNPAGYADILAQEFSIVHTNGRVNDKPGLLGELFGPFEVLAVRWENRNVRILGDVGLLSGDMYNTIRGRERGDIAENPHRVLQVWRKASGKWQMIAMHNTRFDPKAQPPLSHSQGH